jgi:hypothetical protein
MHQKHHDQKRALEAIPSDVTDHDVERAEDTVVELERLGLYPPSSRHR